MTREAELAPEGFRQVRLQAGNTLIKLMDIALPPASVSDQFKPGVRWLTFFVEDIEQTVSDLEQKGVTFLSPPVSVPKTRMAFWSSLYRSSLSKFINGLNVSEKL